MQNLRRRHKIDNQTANFKVLLPSNTYEDFTSYETAARIAAALYGRCRGYHNGRPIMVY